ncbi:PREDICTED: thiamin pyrophosphokinase 1 [Ceratosolen solmsi marchali]|uniref:Thiamin pyrophosphokinase 1 n=1 Tax=Ceratosolen solmsi marchali TaxID=326594 RepID=A0AAJ6YFY9_9HYME|nr:PREDICTED: thiamin pyrophosphokinase 1 [Ceratosolen solmsi marchali]
MQNLNLDSQTVWNPINVFKIEDTFKYAIVILNRPILLCNDQVLSLWEKAQVTVTVDGGTTRWIDYLGDRANKLLTGECKKYLPMLITGDMDSVVKEQLIKLEQMETNVIFTPDIMETDYTKSLIELRKYILHNKIELNGIYVFAETSGRLDQIISNINTLHKSDKLIDYIPIFQIASNSLTWLLKSGKHVINVPDILLKSKSWCALIPFEDTNSCVTTTGLKWNLNKTNMKFSKLISTSNTYDGHNEITVITNVTLVWIMGIEPLTRIYNT